MYQKFREMFSHEMALDMYTKNMFGKHLLESIDKKAKTRGQEDGWARVTKLQRRWEGKRGIGYENLVLVVGPSPDDHGRNKLFPPVSGPS